jgi:hypothetical protein
MVLFQYFRSTVLDSVVWVANFPTLKTTAINTKTELVCNTRSKLQIEEQREYERVLYDNLTFRQMMANAREAKIKQLQEVDAKEKEFETKLVKKHVWILLFLGVILSKEKH